MRIDRIAQFYLRRRLTTPIPATPRAKRPSVAGSGTDVTRQGLLESQFACAAGTHNIAIVPIAALIATYFILESITHPL